MPHQVSDFSVSVEDIRHKTQDEQPCLKLIWLLQGEVILDAPGGTLSLVEGDLAMVNPMQRWRLQSQRPNTIMLLSITTGWLTRMDPQFLACDYQISQPDSKPEHQNKLRTLMRQLLISHLLNHDASARLEANRWLSEIILLLAMHFQQPRKPGVSGNNMLWSPRIRQVVARIESQYSQRLSLAEIARDERVSEAWLSRLFHKEVGVSFMQYTTALRLQKAEEQLLSSTTSVQRIALEQGFASSRVMSDLFKRRHGKTPRQYRQQHRTTPNGNRGREMRPEEALPVATDVLFSLLNRTEKQSAETSPQLLHYQPSREIRIDTLSRRRQSLRHAPVVVTVRELDDLLREDVRRNLEMLHQQIPIYGIDIHEPFLSSALFSEGWDTPLTTECACWYPLQQVFTFLSRMGWHVLLHTNLTTRPDLLRQFLRMSVQHFPASTLASWHFVWHWSTQASGETRQKVWMQQRDIIRAHSPDALLGIWHRFTAPEHALADLTLLDSTLLKEADFLACSANANEGIREQPLDSHQLAAAENSPVDKIRQIHHTLRQRHLTLPIWLLSWNTLTGATRRTNGEFFRGALLMNNLIGLSERTGMTGFWLNSALQREARNNGTFDTSSLSLYYHHGLPRPVYWVLWLWQRLKGEILVNDKQTLLLHNRGRYQLLLRNPVVYNPWLSSEETFIQRFRQYYPLQVGVLSGKWKIKRHLFDQYHGALFPRLEAIESSSGPDEETWSWLAHTTRPALSVQEIDVAENWQLADSLESNALVLYELTPLN
ncbi:helix-turn-helix domain-containing protein [Pseudocitrobacter cyperus]|uniref:Helix-turn-helix domain-containing protein n=1 Tax=Pseudocitrobacter cyperus TaxID=3112843 RepID=A0ABV0HEV4_9ENTR